MRNALRRAGGFRVKPGLNSSLFPAWGGSKDNSRIWRYTGKSETKKVLVRVQNIYEQPSQNFSCHLFHLSRHSVPFRIDDDQGRSPRPPRKDSSSTPGVYRHIAVFTEVLTRIKSEYVEEPDMKNVTLGAMNGLLESIDPYASYLNAEQYKEYLKNFDSYRGDLGLVLAKKFGYITVVAAVPGSPAAKAGLTTGDMIETIKGVATRDMPLAYANLLLKGAPGSSVEISVLQRRPDPHKLTLERTAIQYPPLKRRSCRMESATSARTRWPAAR